MEAFFKTAERVRLNDGSVFSDIKDLDPATGQWEGKLERRATAFLDDRPIGSRSRFSGFNATEVLA